VGLFARLAKDVASKIGVTYPADWEQKYNKLFTELKAYPKE
jgi:hypothetical protein